MSTRGDLHALLDGLPDEALPAVAYYLAAVAAGHPAVPPEDEGLSPEEAAMLDASRADFAHGRVVSHEELGARIADRQEPT